MIEHRRIELLAPARDAECGIEAVKHGADAVYIGAPKFGARAAAGNSIEDIARLTRFAHIYGVRIYVALNVILRDEELEEVRRLVEQLYSIGVDALIIQDMALLEMDLPPIPLHASTQMDNRTIDKVTFLSKVGFEQVVLARELSITEIRRIHEACPQVSLEAFVHGALCVSYGGQCYASEVCFGRSANRGECAQFCRLAFDMVDTDGKVIRRDKHLLSLKDMNRSERLEAMLDAGISSLKIEGRLKDVSYVKNVTAYYRQQLDSIFLRRTEYSRTSSGSSTCSFHPQLEKSFNRGFTSYFLDKREEDIFSPDTPKSIGEPMGVVKNSTDSYITVAGVKPFHNGDGLCYIDEQHHLQGFRINRVDANRLYIQGARLPFIKPHTPLYRNYDHEFEHLLASESAARKLDVDICFYETTHGFAVTMTDEDGNNATLPLDILFEEARSPQDERIENELRKLGNTPFTVRTVEVKMSRQWFVPISSISDLRRRLVDELLRVRLICYSQKLMLRKDVECSYPLPQLTYLGNVMNKEAESFYHKHGVTQIQPAVEKQKPDYPLPIMFSRHCLRYSMGWCPRAAKEKSPYREPYYLLLPDGKRFQLEFDCRQCIMKVIAL